MKSTSGILTALLSLIVSGGSLMHGQIITGSMFGQVSDASGGPVPAASITARNLDAGAESHATTGVSGTYSVLNLQTGGKPRRD